MRPDSFPADPGMWPDKRLGQNAPPPDHIELAPGTYVALNELVTIIQEAQLGLDLEVEELVIFLTVLTGNLQRWHRSQQQTPVCSITEIELVPMSQSAIARATGMARETVRRRMRAMQNRGIIALDARGSAVATTVFTLRLLNLAPFKRLRVACADSATPQNGTARYRVPGAASMTASGLDHTVGRAPACDQRSANLHD